MVLTSRFECRRRHAVDLVAADDGQIRHAHAALARFVDQREPAQELHVAGSLLRGKVEEVLIDAQDDLQVARQHVLHQRHRPGLQRLGHERVVGVAEDTLRQPPGLCPRHLMLVVQHAHHFGHADGRVRVVQVDRHLLGQRVQRTVLEQMPADDVLDRRAGEEVLLAQPQLAPGRRAVVRVKHPGDVLELVLHLGSTLVVATVEGVQVDVLRRGGAPQSQRADFARTVPRHHHVVGFGADLGSRHPARRLTAVIDMAAKAHGIVHTAPRKLPGRAVAEPGIRVLHLPAFDDGLREHAVFVADAVAERRQAERGHRIQETRRQPAQAAIAQGGVGLLLLDLLELLRLHGQGGGGFSLQVQRCQRIA